MKSMQWLYACIKHVYTSFLSLYSKEVIFFSVIVRHTLVRAQCVTIIFIGCFQMLSLGISRSRGYHIFSCISTVGVDVIFFCTGVLLMVLLCVGGCLKSQIFFVFQKFCSIIVFTVLRHCFIGVLQRLRPTVLRKSHNNKIK